MQQLSGGPSILPVRNVIFLLLSAAVDRDERRNEGAESDYEVGGD